MGRQFMMRNNYSEAIRILNALLRFDAKAYEGYFLRGIAKYNLDDLLGADTDFTLAIEHNPVFTKFLICAMIKKTDTERDCYVI